MDFGGSEERPVEHASLEPHLNVALPRESDAAVQLECAARRLHRTVRDVCLGDRRGVGGVVGEVVEGVLGPDYLLSTFSGIDLKPNGGNIQPLHPDDALVPVPRPHERPIGCTVMWVVTEFNQRTGGTRLLPGSQREPLDLLFQQDSERMRETIQPDMKVGSVLVFDHALFHGASDNPSDEWRLGLQVSYHAGWVRPYTNWFRSVPIEEVREFPEKLRDLLGYKTYNGIGSANFEPGSYRENYTGKGRPREPRLSLD